MTDAGILVDLKSLLMGQAAELTGKMSQDDVKAILGPPDDVGCISRRQPKGAILKYGNVELHFEKRCLVRIFLEDFDIPSGGRGLHIEPWIIRRDLTVNEAEKSLGEIGCYYTKVSRYDATFLELASGGVLVFEGQGKCCLLSLSIPVSLNV